MKGVFHRVGIAIEEGDTVSEAIEREGRAFPVLYVRLIRMGEVVGNLDKVFVRLAEYYEFVRALWMKLITRLIYPLIEEWAAIGVLALVAYIRSMFLPNGNGSAPAGLDHPGPRRPRVLRAHRRVLRAHAQPERFAHGA